MLRFGQIQLLFGDYSLGNAQAEYQNNYSKIEKVQYDLITDKYEMNYLSPELLYEYQQYKLYLQLEYCPAKSDWGNINEQVLGEAEYIINNISQLEKNYQNQLLDLLKNYRKGIIYFNNLEILNESLNLRGIQNVKSIRLEKELFGQYKFVNQTETNFDNLKKLINNLANKEKDEHTISTLAHLHYYGDNIFEENTKLACELAENSVNNKLSQFLLGSMYLDGIVKKQNYEMAFQYFHKSFQQGFTQSLTNLGYMFNSGKGVKKDLKMAFKLNEKAALLNNQVAMYNLGYFYEEGLGGIQKNQKLSQYWYNKSAQKGYIKAMEKFYPQKVIVSYKILFDK
ncbi:hypothetical protein PPERSA_12473 [Pseudocohnilembus persalinus]|uniref:Uncharacterized protein n=1 Tax=Pseudocohnilembus persalinus TaxID=266149 RepID=A0A0V0QPL3_PSEPJ|nr:hypothetical protein PPERSA_12473 [Pseudocohnilembus persalinus]|eukprot:KRX04026.1 hypothetical protein PPERSA_12473 [Pseudocohnilembus persalinus]